MSARLSSVVDDYLAYRAQNGYRPNTVKNDRQTLSRLLTHVGDVEVTSITPTDIDRMLGSMLTSRRYSVGSVNNTQSGISAFARWCRSRGYAPQTWDPIAGRRYVPSQATSRTYIPLAEFPVVLDAAERPRDRAFMALGLFTMSRQSEIVGMRVKDLSLSAGVLDVVIQKSYKVDVLPLSSELDREMRRWIVAYQEAVGGPLDPDWFLVPAMQQSSARFGTFDLVPTRPISRSADLVRRVLERCGYTGARMGCHDLRRSAARALFDELAADGYDGALRLVSAMLHHAGTATTEKYLGLDLDRERRDQRIAGRAMFPSLTERDNVIPLTREA